MHRTLITHEERPKINDAALPPIFMRGQWACCYLSSRCRRPILVICIVTTKSLLNNLSYSVKIFWRSLDTHFQNGAGTVWLSLCLWRQPIPHLWMAGSNHFADYQWWETENHWRSITAYFAMGVSTICFHILRHSISLMVFWQPLYCLHVLSPSSLHCSSIIHLNLFFRIYFTVSANCG